jgi:uncharacterized protein YecE (DUF72 family)
MSIGDLKAADNPSSENDCSNMTIYIGTAGWNIRSEFKLRFRPEGSHLERYSSSLNAVEINSSFYRSHQKKTYERWAATVPTDFRFSVKMPKEITHAKGLADVESELAKFREEIEGLGTKLGVILVQLPPKLSFSWRTVSRFFRELRSLFVGTIVCEPRHRSWSESEAREVLVENRISPVQADPPVVPPFEDSASILTKTVYYRWHGSPHIYHSKYSDDDLQTLLQLATDSTTKEFWCIFDNTARGAATANALQLNQMLKSRSQPPIPAGR